MLKFDGDQLERAFTFELENHLAKEWCHFVPTTGTRTPYLLVRHERLKRHQEI